ncbi:MAG: RNA 2'-phosphotransferase, partial [Anaeroplasmataceae bacterium]|nr:RNA 2'-phosphotransferase [Anaeroplasmataceae bacterium]
VMEKERFEIVADKIRAFYGHSNTLTIRKEKGIPPQTLYHGTTHQAIDTILKTGLKPMSRQYVHLSVDMDTAYQVGKRRDETPILLEINTTKAMEDGICFYQGNDKVWLCDGVPSQYIKVL